MFVSRRDLGRASYRLALVASAALSACDPGARVPRPADADLFDVAEGDTSEWPDVIADEEETAAEKEDVFDTTPSDAKAAPCTMTAPTSCPAPAPTYDDVAAVITQRCLSCHDGLGEEWPLTSYQHVVDWTDQIRSAMLDCSMPPPEEDLPMSPDERALILQWIRCGLPE